MWCCVPLLCSKANFTLLVAWALVILAALVIYICESSSTESYADTVPLSRIISNGVFWPLGSTTLAFFGYVYAMVVWSWADVYMLKTLHWILAICLSAGVFASYVGLAIVTLELSEIVHGIIFLSNILCQTFLLWTQTYLQLGGFQFQCRFTWLMPLYCVATVLFIVALATVEEWRGELFRFDFLAFEVAGMVLSLLAQYSLLWCSLPGRA